MLPWCCPAARIRLLRSASPLRAGHPAVLRPTFRRRVDGDVGDGLTDRLPILIVNARVERAPFMPGRGPILRFGDSTDGWISGPSRAYRCKSGELPTTRLGHDGHQIVSGWRLIRSERIFACTWAL